MSELVPSMKLHLGELGDFEATPENTSLYLYLGSLACYSNVFLQGTDPEQPKAGSFVFAHSPAFEDIRDFMLENEYPAHVNLREVPDCDVEAFDRMVGMNTSDIGDSIPDEWLDDGTQS